MIYKEPFTNKIVPQSDYDELMAEYFGMFENKSTIKDNPIVKDTTMSWPQTRTPTTIATPMEKQVGGSHYKDMKIQPMEYILANNLGWAEGNVIKYTTRHRAKGGKQDLEKAIHMLQLIIDLEYPNG